MAKCDKSPSAMATHPIAFTWSKNSLGARDLRGECAYNTHILYISYVMYYIYLYVYYTYIDIYIYMYVYKYIYHLYLQIYVILDGTHIWKDQHPPASCDGQPSPAGQGRFDSWENWRRINPQTTHHHAFAPEFNQSCWSNKFGDIWFIPLISKSNACNRLNWDLPPANMYVIWIYFLHTCISNDNVWACTSLPRTHLCTIAYAYVRIHTYKNKWTDIWYDIDLI